MKFNTLPIVPNPLPDESISSWVERIAIFYGGQYERALGSVYARAGHLPLCQKHDIDTDVEARKSLCDWTNAVAARVPALLKTNPINALPKAARLSYCPACWDADVARGQPPYLRRRWSYWSTVHCPTHECWLSARRPAPLKECLNDGWVAVWRSREAWASAFELSVHQPFAQMLVGFDPAALHLPELEWRSLSADLNQFERATKVSENNMPNRAVYLKLLKLMQSGSMDFPRHKVAEWIEPDGRCRNIPMHVPGSVPVWFGARLVFMLMAVECLRLIRGEEPVNVEVARLVGTSTDVQKSLHSLQVKQSHER